MQSFIGTKILMAQAMTRGEYNTYRGWDIPADENPADEGYLVEYTDGGKANHPNHAGYISWSPKGVFDAAYVAMEDVKRLPAHMVRVAGELAELQDRQKKLAAFIDGNFFKTLEEVDRSDLREQFIQMETLAGILRKRLLRARQPV